MSSEDPDKDTIMDEVSSILGSSKEENRVLTLSLLPSTIFDISSLVGAYNMQQQTLARMRRRPFTGEGINSVILSKLSGVMEGEEAETYPVSLTQREAAHIRGVFLNFIERKDPNVPRLREDTIERYKQSFSSFDSALEQAGGQQGEPPSQTRYIL